MNNPGIEITRESKAVVYPSGTVSGYGHIFSLGVAGIPVVALNPTKCTNFKSRYVKEYYIVPDPVRDYRKFVDWLVEYGRKQIYKPVLFMAEDLYAYIASLCQDRLCEFYFYPYIEPEKINFLFNKKLMIRSAAKAGLNVPYTIFSPLTGKQINDWGIFPAVLKPLVSRFTFNGNELIDVVKFPSIFGSKAIQVNNAKELSEAAGKLKTENIDFCVQQLIHGENRNIVNIKFVSSKDYSIPSCFISRKIRQYPADFGTCTVAQSVYISDIQNYAEKFCKLTGYAGPGCMEFKWDQKEQKWYFIEVNPRLDFWVRMSTLKGVNLPFQQYLSSTEQKMFVQEQATYGRHWIDIEGDLRGYAWRRANKKWSISIFEFIKPYIFFNEAIWNISDPLPGLQRHLAKIMEKIPFIMLPRKMLTWMKNCRNSLGYILSQKAPLIDYSGYDDYWEKREKLGTDSVVYPRFSMALAHIKKSDRVLDYGCGSGEFLRFLQQNGYNNLFGVDIYKAKELPENVVFYHVNEIPKEIKFDVITLLQVVGHIHDAEELIGNLLDLTDRLIVSVPNTGYWHHRMRLLFGRVPVTGVIFHMKEHVRFWTKKDFVEMCQHYGWKIKSLQATEPQRSFLAQRIPGVYARQIMYVLAKETEKY